MFVKATSKRRFGDILESWVNVSQIVKIEPGHDRNLTITTSDHEELHVAGDMAQLLMRYVQEQTLS